MTLSFFAWDGTFIEDANVVEVEAGDVCTLTDMQVASVECNCGWWEVYNIDGILCAYWEEDETSFLGDDESDDPDDYYDDYDSDFGYDPYMGCYTYDC